MEKYTIDEIKLVLSHFDEGYNFLDRNADGSDFSKEYLWDRLSSCDEFYTADELMVGYREGF